MALDPLKFTTIAHRDLAILNPIPAAKLDRMVAAFDLPPGARALDVGCGKAELLMRVIERWGASGLGVDRNETFVAEARARAFDRGVAGQLELESKPVAEADVPKQAFDVAMCVGATHALGGYEKALPWLRERAKPRGLVLVGEGYWRRKPDAGYLKFLGAKPKDYLDHAGNVEAGIAAKLTYLCSATASEDDFDDYEGHYNRAVECHCAEHPDDPDADAMRGRIRGWRDAYLRWGRDTLGFGVYLFRVD